MLVAESHRRDAGAEDNRRRDWLAADLASRTLEDRLVYSRDAIARGVIEAPDYFTRESDRLVAIEDTDGDGVAEQELELARGFGIKTSLGGHDLHGFAWGPDGKLYLSIGDRGSHRAAER